MNKIQGQLGSSKTVQKHDKASEFKKWRKNLKEQAQNKQSNVSICDHLEKSLKNQKEQLSQNSDSKKSKSIFKNRQNHQTNTQVQQSDQFEIKELDQSKAKNRITAATLAEGQYFKKTNEFENYGTSGQKFHSGPGKFFRGIQPSVNLQKKTSPSSHWTQKTNPVVLNAYSGAQEGLSHTAIQKNQISKIAQIFPELSKDFEKQIQQHKLQQQLYIQDKMKQSSLQNPFSRSNERYVSLEIFSTTEFGLRFHKFYSQDLKSQIQKIQTAKFMFEYRCWVMNLPHYYTLLEQIRNICKSFGIAIREIPNFVVNLVLYKTPCSGEQSQFGAFNYSNDPYENAAIDKCLPKDIFEKMSQQQKANVTNILRKNGRVILNDRMGSGKKLVAIATAIVYRPEWPLLIICPNVFVRTWKLEFIKWIPKLNFKTKLQIIDDETMELNKSAQIFIIPYQLLKNQSMQERLNKEIRFQLVIIDQISLLKSNEDSGSAHSKEMDQLVTFIMHFKRVLLLSGAQNLLSTPMDLQNIMRIIRPDYIPSESNKMEFLERYCDPCKKQSNSGGPEIIEFLGTSNEDELKIIFDRRFQVKSDQALNHSQDQNTEQNSQDAFSKDQPQTNTNTITNHSIRRQKIDIDGNFIIQGQIKEQFQNFFFTNQGCFEKHLSSPIDNEDVQTNVDQLLKRTTLSKLPQFVELIDVFLENGLSFIVVCQSQIVLDTLQSILESRKVQLINLHKFFQIKKTEVFLSKKEGENENGNESQYDLKSQIQVIEEINNLPEFMVCEEGGKLQKKNSEHLVVGLLKYQDFQGAKFQELKSSKQYQIFQSLVSTNFESILFSEMYWDIEPIREIESLFAQDQRSETLLSDQKSFPQNEYFLYGQKTADVLLMNSLYQQGSYGLALMNDLELKNCFKTYENDYEMVAKNDSILFDDDSTLQSLIDLEGNQQTQAQIDEKTQSSQQKMQVLSQSCEFRHPSTYGFFSQKGNSLYKQNQLAYKLYQNKVNQSKLLENKISELTQKDLSQLMTQFKLPKKLNILEDNNETQQTEVNATQNSVQSLQNESQLFDKSCEEIVSQIKVKHADSNNYDEVSKRINDNISQSSYVSQSSFCKKFGGSQSQLKFMRQTQISFQSKITKKNHKR